jgi:hypothetical protein
MAFGPLKRGPQTDDPIDAQFKIRVREKDLETIERMARDGVTLPERKIPAGVNKSELTRLALGLDDPPDTTPGTNALDELTRRVNKRGG